MRNSILLLLTISTLFTSCKKEATGTPKTATVQTDNPKASIEALNSEIKQYEVPSEFFKVSVKNPSVVKTKLGTTLYINPSDLETKNGTALGTDITVEIKELTNQQDLFRSNAQTVSNSKLLVSGGAYFINLTSEQNQLQLKKNKTLKVDFRKFTNEKMLLFYGEKDSLGILNWNAAQVNFESKEKQKGKSTNKPKIKDSARTATFGENDEIDDILAYTDKPATKEDKEELKKANKKIRAENINYRANNINSLEDKIYKTIEISKLGWINCDCFVEIPNKTDLQYSFVGTENMIFSNVYLIFTDFNSVMQNGYYKPQKVNTTNFDNIPVGAKVKLIALSKINNKKYLFTTNLTIEKDQKVVIKLQEAPSLDLKSLFGK